MGDGTTCVDHPVDRDRRPGHPRVFHGPIAAANVLLKNANRRDEIRRKFGVKAVEMEGSGIADAAWDGRVGYLVIRGTCDYCNRNKNDAWQKYAAVIAAAYARALIASIPAHAGPRHQRSGPNLADLPGGLPLHPDIRYLYERAFEHGRLEGRMTGVPDRGPSPGPDATQLLENAQRALPASAAEGALSSPTPHEELRKLVGQIRAYLDSFDHDLAREVARELERILVGHAGTVPNAIRREAFELLADVEIIEFKRLRRAAPGCKHGQGSRSPRRGEGCDRRRRRGRCGAGSDRSLPGLPRTGGRGGTKSARGQG